MLGIAFLRMVVFIIFTVHADQILKCVGFQLVMEQVWLQTISFVSIWNTNPWSTAGVHECILNVIILMEVNLEVFHFISVQFKYQPILFCLWWLVSVTFLTMDNDTLIVIAMKMPFGAPCPAFTLLLRTVNKNTASVLNLPNVRKLFDKKVLVLKNTELDKIHFCLWESLGWKVQAVSVCRTYCQQWLQSIVIWLAHLELMSKVLRCVVRKR